MKVLPNGVDRIRLITSVVTEEQRVRAGETYLVPGFSKTNDYRRIVTWIGGCYLRQRNSIDGLPLGACDLALELAMLWNAGGPCLIGHGFRNKKSGEAVYTRQGQNVLLTLDANSTAGCFNNNNLEHRKAAVEDSIVQVKVFLDAMHDDTRFGKLSGNVALNNLINENETLLNSLTKFARVSVSIDDLLEYKRNYDDLTKRTGLGPHIYIGKTPQTPAWYRENLIKLYLIDLDCLRQERSFAHRLCNRLNGIKAQIASVNTVRATHSTNPASANVEVFVPRVPFEALFGLHPVSNELPESSFITNLAQQSQKIEIEVKSIPVGEVPAYPGQHLIHCFLIIRWAGSSLRAVRDSRFFKYRDINWMAPLFKDGLEQWVYRLWLVTTMEAVVSLVDLSSNDESAVGKTDKLDNPCSLTRGSVTINFADLATLGFDNALVFEIMSCEEMIVQNAVKL